MDYAKLSEWFRSMPRGGVDCDPDPACILCHETLADGAGVRLADGFDYCRDCAHEETEARREEDTLVERRARNMVWAVDVVLGRAS